MSGLQAQVELLREGFRLHAALACAEGEIVGLVGPSGAGKTTLLRCLAGLERRCRGHVEVGSLVWQDGPRDRFVPPHRRRAGVVFQDGALLPHLSVRGNLEYGWRRRGRRDDLGAVVEALGLAALLPRAVDGLSGGERQRVALGRALLADPALLLLDEPLAAVDAAARAALGATLRALCRQRGVPTVLVSHSRAEVLRLADRITLLEGGAVAAEGVAAAMATALGAVPGDPGEDLAALVEGTVLRHEDSDALTVLAFPGGVFTVPRLAAPVGATHRLLVAARDVSLALERPAHTSILNVYAARVVAIDDGEAPQPLVRLAVGETQLVARITRRSLRELGLAPGSAVFAQVKAVALA